MSVPVSIEFFPPNTPAGHDKLVQQVVPALGAMVVVPGAWCPTPGAGTQKWGDAR